MSFLVNEIMTPRTVVHAIDDTETVSSLLKKSMNIPFARIPVYHDQIDNITGVVRRRDILKAKANNEDEKINCRSGRPTHFHP